MKHWMLCFTISVTSLLYFTMATQSYAEAKVLEVGDSAPAIQLTASDGSKFDLNQRKGKWTVLYFYPKADTPGCTKQACAFRDNIKKITDLNAEVFGISSDNKSDLQSFKKKYQLNFTLLADPDFSAIDAYGARKNEAPVSQRWTFIVDPNLKIASIDKDVDPVMDAQRVAQKIKSLTK